MAEGGHSSPDDTTTWGQTTARLIEQRFDIIIQNFDKICSLSAEIRDTGLRAVRNMTDGLDREQESTAKAIDIKTEYERHGRDIKREPPVTLSKGKQKTAAPAVSIKPECVQHKIKIEPGVTHSEMNEESTTTVLGIKQEHEGHGEVLKREPGVKGSEVQQDSAKTDFKNKKQTQRHELKIKQDPGVRCPEIQAIAAKSTKEPERLDAEIKQEPLNRSFEEKQEPLSDDDVEALRKVLESFIIPAVPICCEKCESCKSVSHRQLFTSYKTEKEYLLKISFSCHTEYAVYLISCENAKCLTESRSSQQRRQAERHQAREKDFQFRYQYVGETGTRMMDRMKTHRSAKTGPIRKHCKTANHDVSDMKWTVIEVIKSEKDRKDRETYWIQELQADLNTQKTNTSLPKKFPLCT
ncbi:uncharacterized protein [Littorina saxatilis]|uniref:uncharacterized protein n=1 Tax=Littorina saxatilis TaxID=31220 RepID=UPI0038B5B1C2